MKGRPRLNPDHAMTSCERQRRWRVRHPLPPKPPQPESPIPELKTFGEIAAELLPPEQPPERLPFDPRALIG
jgi:hypothetical protein